MPAKKQKHAKRKIRRKGSSLHKSIENLYKQYFVATPHATDENAGQSLEQPSPLRVVPTITNYGVDDAVFRMMSNA